MVGTNQTQSSDTSDVKSWPLQTRGNIGDFFQKNPDSSHRQNWKTQCPLSWHRIRRRNLLFVAVVQAQTRLPWLPNEATVYNQSCDLQRAQGSQKVSSFISLKQSRAFHFHFLCDIGHYGLKCCCLSSDISFFLWQLHKITFLTTLTADLSGW